MSDGPRLIQLACQMAISAKNKFVNSDIKVAFSVPPLFGSYRPDLFEENIDKAEKLYKFFMDSVSPLDEQIDLFLFETLSSTEEARQMCDFMQGKDKPYMISFCLNDETCELRKGKLTEIGELLKDF